jgi:spore germination protein GerM
MSLRGWWGGLGATILLLVTVAGCGIQPQDAAAVIDDEDVPFELLDSDAEPVIRPPVDGDQPGSLCYIADAGRIVVIEQRLDEPVTLTDAVAALATPPDSQSALRTAIGDADFVRSVDSTGGIARVDLGDRMSTLGGDDQLLAVAQLVCTLTHRPGIGQVSFTLDGSPIDVPHPDGSLVSEPLSRDDYATLFE